LSEMEKYELWKCYKETKNIEEAEKLKRDLENSSSPLMKLLLNLSSQLDDLSKLKIYGLDAKFDTYSIKIFGYVRNSLSTTVMNVKVKASASDKYGNNSKEGYDYIDLINSGKKSYFEVSLYYGSNRPSSIKYGARVVDHSK